MIQLDKVTKTFGNKTALDSLSINLPKGEIYGLLGSNGAGKSTTLSLLLGFIRPDHGSVRLDGMDPFDRPSRTRKSIGYIAENVSLYPYLSGLENLDYFCRIAGLRYPKSKLSATLSECGLPSTSHDLPLSGYSKGMRQKVGIAIAYAKNATVYLLDEPASGLDPAANLELSQLLQKLARQGATILIASHDLLWAKETCDQLGILRDGKLMGEYAALETSIGKLEKTYLDFMKQPDVPYAGDHKK
ncbi:ABC transporter ATP-binding protein [Echinicola rosea]|uniref:ABC transporter ATP-binding protein n=1 Tax=Echinicola rosea TaxID=1807691 RepID=A0ABQ1V8P3_9BACT|nr:ABC transporter ATP-binding protein [Echinicola rosea]GGF44479.1 ABC transporter ATP-binding protein [Echinicola rosea]